MNLDDNEKLREELGALYWKVKDMYLSLERFMEEDTRFRISQAVQKAREKHRVTTEVIGTPVDTLDVTVRTSNCLKYSGIPTVEELVKYTERDLMKIDNLGRKSVNEIRSVLASMNLKLKGE